MSAMANFLRWWAYAGGRAICIPPMQPCRNGAQPTEYNATNEGTDMDIVPTAPHDVLLRGGRVIDPAQGLDGIFDVAVRDGRIAAVAKNLAASAKETIDVRGKLVLPGLIDTHAHVYRYVSGRFALNADTVRVHSGPTTSVHQ